ncbi:uncharacterized protein LOC131640749 [Vicia villosa]|uniref:uncharacterized protein LOC131640749 n=1 Tax=Vicia villosa TaxID=3911 RepID=UPI00273BE988|nr:uncharacterized protein LOC131640749 [Vicia villosa]
MADLVKQLLAKPIQLADQVSKAAEEGSSSFKQECLELKSKTEKLASLLRQAARSSSDLYERPTRRIIGDTEQVLEKALTLVLKCKVNGLMKRVFSIVPSAAFRKMSSHLENSIGDVSWLLRVSAPTEEGSYECLGLPPIASNEPILGLIWEQIAILHNGSVDDRSDAAASLVSLVRDNDRNGKLIIEEGGVGPLLKLIKEGKKEGQENAAKAIGLLGRDAESVDVMIHAGVCSVFAKILKEGPMKVQAVVAWAVSELVSKNPKCQDVFAQHNIVRLLVSHIAFETVQEHSKYAIVSNKPNSIHAVVLASGNSNSGDNSGSNNVRKETEDEVKIRMQHPLGDRSTNQMHKVVASTMAMHAANANNNKNQQTDVGNEVSLNSHSQVAGNSNGSGNGNTKQNYSYSGISMKGRELEDAESKAEMKAMAAKALMVLAKDNSGICRSITESRALLCFAILLEKGPEEVKYHSALALKEITAVAEKDPELRRMAFKPNSPACKAVVDQVIDIIDKEDKRLLIPCVKAIGSLARTFRATETRIIGPLVRLLDEREAEVSKEAADSLAKFACNDNYLHLDHSKAIISSGGAKHLVQLVYLGEPPVQYSALVLLSYIALHVPDSEELARVEVLGVLEWASKQLNVTQDENVEMLLQESKSRLELYQSRGSRGFQKLHQ